MTTFTQSQVWQLYEDSLTMAEKYLKKLEIASNRIPAFAGLSGWVFEQTIQYCIRSTLNAKGLNVAIVEQGKIGRRGKADLIIGRIAIEIKLSGIFSQSAIERYRNYAKQALDTGFVYLYITGGERYQPYRAGIISAVGHQNTFFLDTPKEWTRFTTRVIRLLK